MEKINLAVQAIGYAFIAIAAIMVLVRMGKYLFHHSLPEKACCCVSFKELLIQLAEEGQIAQKLLDAEEALKQEKRKSEILCEEMKTLVFFHSIEPANERFWYQRLEKAAAVNREQIERHPENTESRLKAEAYQLLLQEIDWHRSDWPQAPSYSKPYR